MSEKGKLIVLAAFDRSEDGNLVPAFEPRQFDSIDLALQEALGMADRHVGVIAWMRDADPYLGEYGPPTVLFQNGDIPELG